MVGAFVNLFENFLRWNSRRRGVDHYPDPSRYFDPGGVEEAAIRCAEVNKDLPTWIRPPAEPAAAPILSHRSVVRRDGVRAEEICYPSSLPSGRPHNDRVEMRVYRNPDCVVRDRVLTCHHPIYMGDWGKLEWFLNPVVREVPVAVMAAPNHFGRVEPGDFPGEWTLNPNPWRMFEAIRQWSHDQAVATIHLRERLGLEPAAVLGYSFGAFQTFLLASAGGLDQPLVTVASTNRYAHGVLHGPLANGALIGMRQVGIDADRLWEMTDSLQVERHVGELAGRPLLNIRAEWDRVDPPPSLDRLEEALRPSPTVRLRAGHGTLYLRRRPIAELVLAFLRDSGAM